MVDNLDYTRFQAFTMSSLSISTLRFRCARSPIRARRSSGSSRHSSTLAYSRTRATTTSPSVRHPHRRPQRPESMRSSSADSKRGASTPISSICASATWPALWTRASSSAKPTRPASIVKPQGCQSTAPMFSSTRQ